MPAASDVMEPPEHNPPLWNGLKARVLSAFALALAAWLALDMGGIAFTAFVLLAALLLMKEWETLTTGQMLLLRLFGYPYIILPCACLLWLRCLSLPSDQNFGFTLCVALMAVISATDIAAYFTGKRFGRRKLAPTISPGKTWEGTLGGLAAAAITGIIFSPYLHVLHSLFSVLAASLLISVIAQLGDLFKSWIKRMAGVKDSGTLLPGHGGLLDRLDGYMFATPVLAVITYFSMN